MRSGLFRVIGGLAACVALLVSSASLATAARQASNTHVIVGGYADIFASTCPFTNEPPLDDVECEDWVLQFVKERVGSNANKTAWMVFLFRARYTLHPDGTSDTSFQTSGVKENPIRTSTRLASRRLVSPRISRWTTTQVNTSTSPGMERARRFRFRETPVHST